MKNELGVSVVICCHNSAERLPNTLAHLAGQQVPENLPWEAIVVDNASTDNTAAVARSGWPTDGTIPLRVLHEPQLGKMYAFQLGLAEAKYDFVSFLDDDNWISPDWIRLAYETLEARPDVGACGGQIEAVAEVPPPWWFEAFKGDYAVGEQAAQAGDITSERGYLWGAGLTIRKKAWEGLLQSGFQFTLTCRSGNKLSAGGDTEVCFALRQAGWHLWYEPRLKLQHFIPVGRLNWRHVRRLHHGFGASEVELDAYQFARNGPSANRKGRFIQDAWLRQMIIETKALLRFRGKLLRALWQPMEGDPDVLDIERLAGKIGELFRSRSTYEQRLRDVDRLANTGTS